MRSAGDFLFSSPKHMHRQTEIAKAFQFGLAPTVVDGKKIESVSRTIVTQPFGIAMREWNDAKGLARNTGFHHGTFNHHVAFVKCAGVRVEGAAVDIGLFISHLPWIGIGDADDEHIAERLAGQQILHVANVQWLETSMNYG